MTPTPLHELANALHAFGYTPTQALFVTFVILHSGVFLRRQYRGFCEALPGSLDHELIRKLLARRHASALPYHGRERLYHINGKRLYAALSRQDDSHRRPPNAALCAQRLLTLDYLLAAPDHLYLTSEFDKTVLFTELEIPRELWPARTFTGRHDRTATTTRYFAEKFPLYHDPRDGVVFLFPHAVSGTSAEALDTFLARYLLLFRALPAVTLRYLHSADVLPARAVRALTRFQRDPERRFPELRGDLRRYFTVRERLETHQTQALTLAVLDRHRADRVRFQDGTYDRAYAMWRHLNPAYRYRAFLHLDALPAAREIQPLAHFSFCTHAMPYRYAFQGALPSASTMEITPFITPEPTFQ